MKRGILSIVSSILCIVAASQVNFRTVAPPEPIVEGESFEIQYIIEGEENIEAFTPPSFKSFRYVTGPHVYKGSVTDLNVVKPLVNTVYTLAALKPGRYIIHGAKAIVNGIEINSNDLFIEVISKLQALDRNKRRDGSYYKTSEYFLRPGEDPMEKIRQNLFVKVNVNKKSCYVGEPVVATFKLYSRLESKSDIIKNPGFYGFAVHDMINLADRAQATEVVNGKTFDVHTVRLVQLYPLQAGQFMIDPMEISNRVEFSRSEINKKTEQEIAEGIFGNEDDKAPHNNAEVYENTVRTTAVKIHVKPLPVKNRMDSFTAAVGVFSLKAELEKSELAKNETGTLVVTISGKGNFTQINPLSIRWPQGLDGFEPAIRDSIDRLKVPLTGTKTFRYAFVATRPGIYKVPAIEFNFFDPDTNHFRTLTTNPLTVHVSPKEKARPKIADVVSVGVQTGRLYYWLIGGLALMLVLSGLALFLRNKKRKEIPSPVVNINNTTPSMDEFLLAPQMMVSADDKSFYNELNHAIWAYLRQVLHLSGSEMNKTALAEKLNATGINERTVADLVDILKQCETGIYTNVSHEEDKAQLLSRAAETLKGVYQKK